jgi:hypothetical protein
MDRDVFLDWARQLLAVQLRLPPTQVERQANNVQHGFSDPRVKLVTAAAAGIGIGVVANVQSPEVRVHLFTYDEARIATWRAAPPPHLAAPYALPLCFRDGDKGRVAYLEFKTPVEAMTDFARWCPTVFGYVAFFTSARDQGLLG